MSTRKALHAGSWYSGSKSVLKAELDGWLSKAMLSHAPARAIIAPHAGLTYCGSCAAYAYKQVDPTNIKRVFILGPSHHIYLSGCALSSNEYYETPFYNLKIDETIYAELLSTGLFEKMSQTVDEEEHSLEMHLPYIAKVMEKKRDQFTIVPVLVGALKEAKEVEYGQLFSKYLADSENLFVISSDFCHWGSRFRYTRYNKEDGPIYKSIEKLDQAGMDKIESLDPQAFSSYLQETQNTICGRHPIAVLLNSVSHIQSSFRFELHFTHYSQSGQCNTSSDSSVSYAAASLTTTTTSVPLQ